MPEQLEAPLVDANLVLWAHHDGFPRHEEARRWWARTLSVVPQVGIPWPTIIAFVRISTHPRALERPLDVARAWATVAEWLDRPNVWIPVPTVRHRQVLESLLIGGQAAGNHAPDAHLAALAVEWGLELQSADRDFARYPGLRWRDPLA
ncbi:MAG TPA: TA system VapC family ribonuclease toxin [Candidatus Dormibacteraeota bacterium]|nr:TA system VapC family ribonuclease toxin [Candidatus Dormibacteraeota bacterium]